MALRSVLLGSVLGLGLYGAPVWAGNGGATGEAAMESVESGTSHRQVAPAALAGPALIGVSAAATSSGVGRAAPAALLVPRDRYPETRRDNLHEAMFGQSVADPYRWLEGDIRRDPAVSGWAARENALTRAYLAALPGRDRFAARLRALYDFERISLPKKAGQRYFLLRNSGLMNQSALYVREGLAGRDRLLFDPNAAGEGAPALDAWAPSRNGRYLAFTESRAGSDWRTIHVIDVDTGTVMADRLEWANDTLIGWAGDEGFFYSRYPAPPTGEEYRGQARNKAIWFHRVGTAQDADEQVYATPAHPDWGHKAQVTSDGAWAVISTDAGTAPMRAIHLVNLSARGADGRWQVVPLVSDLTFDWKLVDGEGNRLWFITNDGAPDYRLVRVDLGTHARVSTVIGEQRSALEAGRIVGDRLILSYNADGRRLAVVTDMHGHPARAITIDATGTASGFEGRPGDPETFYQFSSYNQPPAVYRMDIRTGRASAFALPRTPFDPSDYVVEQRQYPSRDGALVPLMIVRKKALADAATAAPTLLYGYGGFDISVNPAYSPQRMAWLEAGGVFAVAAVRGGGELGPSWYEAGRAAKKQNSFDDFIAAGDYLVKNGIARKGSLAAQGASNGGMMVAAVINQRPDLFVAANPDVGVMDMLRFDRFTQGRGWTDDYGDPAREADWRVLRSYSPYHNIRAGTDYPAILVTTADTDDRVVPAHSFKYVAALQGSAIGDRPHLLRVEDGAGHGAGKPLDKTIATGADVLAFLAAWTGLSPLTP
nr:prolyl oligopeptidase family serine peptidase [Novosphingobium nitrogenifigens]